MDSTIFTNMDDEQFELEKKISKLELFMISNNFMDLCDLQKSLLSQQYNAMCTYNNILCVRLRVAGYNVAPDSERDRYAK